MNTSIKEDLVRYYSWLRKYGYNDSHSGNASVRRGDTVWITPSGACADTLQAEDLVACDVRGPLGENASYDVRLHLETYKKCPVARTVLHSHGPYTIAMTMSGEDFTPVDFEGKLYFPKVPVHTIAFEQYSKKSPATVAATLRDYCITVVCGHGVYARAESLNLAYKWTCSLEHSAKIAYLTRWMGKS